VISLDLDRALDDPDLAAALNTLVPFGLGLSAGDIVVRQHRVDTLPPALKDACLGTTTIEELRHLFAGTDMLVQVARPVQASARDIRHALHAAASRCAVVVLGTLDPLDPRADFAHSFDDIAALRLFVSRFQMDAVHAQLHMQSGWRHVHSTFGASAPAARIAQCIDPGAPVPAPARLRATVVTPTMRPERLAHILATFRAQTWDNKELLIVANTDTPEQWDTGLLQSENAEQIAFLPSGFGPATALNMGATRGGGDYVLRMDDDDAYGPHYVGDLMLAADALQPDVMGKTASFFNYVDEDRLLRIDAAFNRPEFYNSSQIYAGGHIAGFSHVVRRSVLLRTPYTEGLHAAVDVGFLDDLHDDGSLLCLRVDAMNAVVERRADVRSHTWQNAPGPQDARYVPLHVDVDTVLGTGRTL
jgi:hypothetical protein